MIKFVFSISKSDEGDTSDSSTGDVIPKDEKPAWTENTNKILKAPTHQSPSLPSTTTKKTSPLKVNFFF